MDSSISHDPFAPDGDFAAPVEPDEGPVEIGETEVVGTPPPKTGSGSGLDHWRAYAEANGFRVPDEAKRGDIIDAMAADGFPTDHVEQPETDEIPGDESDPQGEILDSDDDDDETLDEEDD